MKKSTNKWSSRSWKRSKNVGWRGDNLRGGGAYLGDLFTGTGAGLTEGLEGVSHFEALVQDSGSHNV